VLAERLRAYPDYPRAADLSLTLLSFAGLTVSRVALVPVFAVLGRQLMPRQRWGSEHEMRVQRFAGQLWKVLFHGSVTVLPLLFLRNEPWFAPLPGFGDHSKIFTNYPYVPPVPWLREYYLFQLGYYFHALVVTLLQRGRPNLVSMTVHHAATIALVTVSCFLQNHLRLGTLVFWVHDVCDVPVCLTRLVVDLGITSLTYICYFTLLASWAVFRLVVFPVFVVKPVCFDAFRFGWVAWRDSYACAPQTILLCLLVVMHIIWFSELLNMFRVYKRTGSTTDSTETPCVYFMLFVFKKGA